MSEEKRKPIVYALGKPAQRAVLALVREREQLLAQVKEVSEALADLAHIYGVSFNADCPLYDFTMDNGQVVLLAYPATAPTSAESSVAAEETATAAATEAKDKPAARENRRGKRGSARPAKAPEQP